MPPLMRAIRGAIQVEENSAAAMHRAVAELCRAVVEANGLTPEELISAIFTVTTDLNADFPARAAREEGWGMVPMICALEIPVPGSMPRVCRLLLHVQGEGESKHVYLGGAAALRPDLSGR